MFAQWNYVLFFLPCIFKNAFSKTHTAREIAKFWMDTISRNIFLVSTSRSFMFELCYALRHILLCMTLQLVFVFLHTRFSSWMYKGLKIEIPALFLRKENSVQFWVAYKKMLIRRIYRVSLDAFEILWYWYTFAV